MNGFYVDQWRAVCEAEDWEFCADDGDGLPSIVDEVMRTRHANNPLFDKRNLSDQERNEYGRLNGVLHDRMTETARRLFRDTPLPDEYTAGNYDSEWTRRIGTPFTYQNSDWYGPTYECYIAVLHEYLSTEFVSQLQKLLVNELENWCIVLGTASDLAFDADEAMRIYSDQVIDAHTAEIAGIVSLICPRCREVTEVNKRGDGILWVRPDPAEDTARRPA
jgi:hypothetical protein